MQNTAEEIHDNQNGSANAATEGSTSMTIEYLRARLHSERSVTKAARERASELAKRVAELEEQLKIVSLQRKKAEKATLDVLALLENHGMAEISDEYDSDSGMEESLYEPNLEKENSVVSKRKDGSSGSEHDTPTGRSLSWKSSKDSPRSCERKCIDPSLRKRSNFAQSAFSSRHRVGKSCRQIKRREVRSIVEESRHESRSPDVDDSAIADHSVHIIDGSDPRPEESRKCSENSDEKALHNDPNLISSEAGQVSDGSFLQKQISDGEMERALQHQAHLIGRYAAEEKAQREWEEKYMGNGCSIQDSYEPGNQSDVTEERDVPEERAQAQALAPSPTKIVASNTNTLKSEEPICFTKGSSIKHFESFKFSTNPAMESSHNLKVKEGHSSRTSSSDFAFPVATETNVLRDNYVTNSPPKSSRFQSQHHSPYNHTFPSINSGSSYHQAETQPNPRNNEYAIVPHDGPQELGGVLNALEQAKQLLGKNISSLPPKEVRSVGSAAETLVSATRNAEMEKMAVGSAGLFRVPTDFQFEASGPQATLLSSGYPSHLNDYSYHSSTPLIGFDQNLLHSIETRPSASNLDPFFSSMLASSEPRVSNSKPWYGLPSASGFTAYSSNSIYPDAIRRISSSDSSYIVQSPSRTSGLPPTGRPFLYNDHIRPGMYR